MKPVDQARNALAFLEDDTHEHAFDTLIWGLRERRDAAAREVPEWEDLRTLASQIKGHTLSHLAHYLELFEERAARNGARQREQSEKEQKHEKAQEGMPALVLDVYIAAKTHPGIIVSESRNRITSCPLR